MKIQMIKPKGLFIPIVLYELCGLLYDVMLHKGIGSGVEQSVFYFVSHHLFLSYMLLYAISGSHRIPEILILSSFFVVSTIRIYLNLGCLKCDYDIYRDFVTQSWVDKLQWLAVSMIILISLIKWVLHYGHGKFGSQQ